MKVGTAKLFFGDLLASGGLHKGRSTKEDGTTLLDHDNFIGHGGDVRSTSSAAAHNHSNLGNTFSGHPGLVIEDSSEVVTVGEHVILLGKEGASRVNQVDTWQVILFCDLLRSQVLLNSDGVICTTLKSEVIGENHALLAIDDADARNHVTGGHSNIVASQLTNLEEG